MTTLRPSSGTLGAQKTVGAARPTAHGAPLAATHASGELPFTGAQLAIFTIVGLALIGGGVLLRSSGRSRNTA